MKGVMGFLEKAGFVRAVDGSSAAAAADSAWVEPARAHDPLPASAEPRAPVGDQPLASLPEVYAAAGVPASSYPAEKMLRLLDGLKAMDQSTQRAAVAAMDAADDAWSIEDPIRDAEHKMAALAAHADSLRRGIEQAEAQTLGLISAVKQREEGVVADIRGQIAGLEELMSREIARSVQEQADLAHGLATRREAALRQIEQVLATSSGFRMLLSQFRQAPPQAVAAPTGPGG